MESLLKPPKNFVIPSKRKKRSPGEVDLTCLKEQQVTAWEDILQYLDDDKTKFLYYVLKGYAGTGKTFLISRFEEWLIYHRKYKIAVTAPTNKAVAILRDMCDINSKSLEFKTLHSLLGLKLHYTNDGKITFEKNPEFNADLCKYDLLIVDEVSMLNITLFLEIHHFIQDNDCKTKVLFIGDPAQIPPVDFEECIPFQDYFKNKYRMGESILTDIHRQKSTNPILEYATHLRKNRNIEPDDFDYKLKVVNGEGIIPINKEDKDTIYQICKNYFGSKYYKEYPDFIKVIAYRNVTVAAVNKRIRFLIYGKEDLPRIITGERLIVNAPIIRSVNDMKTIQYTTNAEIEVLSEEVKDTVIGITLSDGPLSNMKLKYYECEVKDCSELLPVVETIRIIHEDSLKVYKSILSDAEMRISLMPAYDRKANWRKYFQFKETWADVDYSYAITAHKAQGSTYENVVMLNWDMMLNTRYIERNRIRYVAASRAKSRLFIIN